MELLCILLIVRVYISLSKNAICVLHLQDLQHPNEFIRGSTLRFLCKLKESELLEPLMPAIRACLEHRHSYVRRNAVLAIYTIYRCVDGSLCTSEKQTLKAVFFYISFVHFFLGTLSI